MSLLRCRNVLARHPRTWLAFLIAFTMWSDNLSFSQWLLQGLFQKLPHLTCECCPWHCSWGSTARDAERGIYLDGNSLASSFTIPEALSGLPANNVVSCCHLWVLRRAWYHLQTLTSGCSWSLVHRWQTLCYSVISNVGSVSVVRFFCVTCRMLMVSYFVNVLKTVLVYLYNFYYKLFIQNKQVPATAGT